VRSEYIIYINSAYRIIQIIIEIKVEELHRHNTLHQIHVSSPYRLPKHPLAISCRLKCKCVEIKCKLNFRNWENHFITVKLRTNWMNWNMVKLF